MLVIRLASWVGNLVGIECWQLGWQFGWHRVLAIRLASRDGNFVGIETWHLGWQYFGWQFIWHSIGIYVGIVYAIILVSRLEI